jgi:nicotinamide mononucleotide transporter
MAWSSELIGTTIETLAVLSSLAFTWLATKQLRAAWIFGIGSALFTAILCYQSRLLAELSLQIYYLGISIYAYLTWFKKDQQTASLTILRMPFHLHIVVLLLGSLLTIAMGWFWTLFDAALPYIDSFTTSFSLLAVWLLSKKFLESWIYWIIIDTVSVFLYAQKDLILMAALFIAYTILAFYGYWKWRTDSQKEMIT